MVKKLAKKAITSEDNKNSEIQKTTSGFKLAAISAKTHNQKKAFSSFKNKKHLVLYGVAGTGKTFIATYLALSHLLAEKNNSFEKIIIVRSIVPSRDIGFLPGNAEEKTELYETPYISIFSEFFGEKKNAYQQLKQKKIVDFVSTSYIRGTTFNNAIIIVDEIQNLSFQELHTVITRVGENCRIIFCGDYRQSDLKSNEKYGILKFLKIIRKIPLFDFIEFDEDDIVRSDLVKQYILAELQFEKETAPKNEMLQ